MPIASQGIDNNRKVYHHKIEKDTKGAETPFFLASWIINVPSEHFVVNEEDVSLCFVFVSSGLWRVFQLLRAFSDGKAL